MHIGKGKVTALKDRAQAEFDEMLIEHYHELREAERHGNAANGEEISGLFDDGASMVQGDGSLTADDSDEDAFVRPVIRTRGTDRRGTERREFAPAAVVRREETNSFRWSRFGVSAAVMAGAAALVWVVLKMV